jgi:hypothetical protein
MVRRRRAGGVERLRSSNVRKNEVVGVRREKWGQSRISAGRCFAPEKLSS